MNKRPNAPLDGGSGEDRATSETDVTDEPLALIYELAKRQARSDFATWRQRQHPDEALGGHHAVRRIQHAMRAVATAASGVGTGRRLHDADLQRYMRAFLDTYDDTYDAELRRLRETMRTR